jgi:hypothetical protein
MKQILENIKHLSSSLAGVCIAFAATLQADQVQALLRLSPKIATRITTAATIASALGFILGRVSFEAGDGIK